MKKFITLANGLFLATILIAQTNPTAQSLPFSQDFSTLLATSTIYPAGFQGWNVASAPGAVFNTAAPLADRTLTASGTAASNAGNEYNYDSKIGFLNNASLDLSIVLALNTTGQSGIEVNYDIMTIRNPYDATTNTRINEVTLQYRIGTSGTFTTLTGGGLEYQNNTTLQTTAITTPQNLQSKTVTLPADCNNQPVVQIRWISRQVSGGGARPSFAIDNITVDGGGAPALSVSAGTDAFENSSNGSFSFAFSSTTAATTTFDYSFSGTASFSTDYQITLSAGSPTTLTSSSGTITVDAGLTSIIATVTPLNDAIAEPVKTIQLDISNVSGGYTIGSSSASISLFDDDIAHISLTGGVYSQDFNSLANTATGSLFTLPSGWIFSESGTGANTTYTANSGTGTSGDTYSYGTGTNADRAFGTLQTNAFVSTIGASFTNNTGVTITRLGIAYTGEQWRFGATGRTDFLNFEYSTDATNLTSGTWTPVSELSFTAPVNSGTTGSLDGNTFHVLISFTLQGITIPDGATFFIRWVDPNVSGADDGIGVDDFSIEPNPADITPPSVNTLFPANGASAVPTNFTASIVFNETVLKGTGNIILKKSGDNSVVQTIDVTTAAVTVSGTNVSFNLNELAVNTGFYIEIDNGAFKDQSDNNFAGISGSSTWSFTTGTLFYTANFQNCTSSLSNGFTQYSQVGSIIWTCTPFGRDPNNPTASLANGVQMNGFAGGTNVPNTDWLISPSFNLTNTTYPLLSFWSRTQFNGEPLELKVSTDYTGGDPSLATWVDINGKFPEETSNIWTLSENINLTAFKGTNVHFAFVYHSSSDDGARWTIDDIAINNSPDPPPPSLTIGTANIQFPFTASGNTTTRSFTIIGNDLTNDISLNVTGPFTISKDNSLFSTSLVYTVAEANNIPKTVYVRFTPPVNKQNFTGNVVIESGGLTANVALSGTSIDPATTLEVVNWNIEWFGSPVQGPTNDAQQQQNVSTILQNLNADIYAVSEIVDESRLAAVVSQMDGYEYVISNYGSHTNTNESDPSPLSEAQKLAFIYKTSVFTNVTTTALLSQGINSVADLTNPAYDYWASGRFPFMLTADVTLNCITKNVKFILVHAKANTAPTTPSYNRRKLGADSLHYTLQQNYADDNIIILGDYNDDLDESITDGFTVTSWSAFTNDTEEYEPLTLPLSLAGKKSTVSHDNVIDHVIVSNEMEQYYMSSTANILTDVTSLVVNYGSSTSDHYPVFTRYIFENNVAPGITNCTASVAFCENGTTMYTVPAFVATDDCEDVVTYAYTITGATTRSGNTNNASGSFNAGVSTITWNATDDWGNTASCQTTVTVNTNPTVAIPDAYALNSGTLANTVYIGYNPASSISLSAVPSGGAPGYSYNWSNGATSSAITVSPGTTTVYSVTITDQNNCQATANKQVTVMDIRSGKKLDKVLVCHNQAMTLTVGVGEVATHLSHGDMLGSCVPTDGAITKNSMVMEAVTSGIGINVMPNPSSKNFTLKISADAGSPITLRVMDISGRLIERRNLTSGQSVGIGDNYRPGLYLAEVQQGNQRKLVKLIKI